MLESVMKKHRPTMTDAQIDQVLEGQNALEFALLNVSPSPELISDCHKALVLAEVEPLPLNRRRVVQL